jgi:hypothetical protein
MKNAHPLLQNYCVGIDVSKDKFDVCFLAGYDDRSTKVKASTKFDNTPKGILDFSAWVQRHRKETVIVIDFIDFYLYMGELQHPVSPHYFGDCL